MPTSRYSNVTWEEKLKYQRERNPSTRGVLVLGQISQQKLPVLTDLGPIPNNLHYIYQKMNTAKLVIERTETHQPKKPHVRNA